MSLLGYAVAAGNMAARHPRDGQHAVSYAGEDDASKVRLRENGGHLRGQVGWGRARFAAFARWLVGAALVIRAEKSGNNVTAGPGVSRVVLRVDDGPGVEVGDGVGFRWCERESYVNGGNWEREAEKEGRKESGEKHFVI